jgi:hypothetical protein
MRKSLWIILSVLTLVATICVFPGTSKADSIMTVGGVQS